MATSEVPAETMIELGDREWSPERAAGRPWPPELRRALIGLLVVASVLALAVAASPGVETFDRPQWTSDAGSLWLDDNGAFVSDPMSRRRGVAPAARDRRAAFH